MQVTYNCYLTREDLLAAIYGYLFEKGDDPPLLDLSTLKMYVKQLPEVSGADPEPPVGLVEVFDLYFTITESFPHEYSVDSSRSDA